ncbi:MAG: aldo/keto reductase [Chitinophagaceae bacterium]
MNYRQLGKSKLHVSDIGFGCMSLGKDQEANQHLIHSAIESGINFFDTADIYDKGFNEITLGKILKEKRHQLIIATKVGNVLKPDGSSLDWNPTKEHILSAIDQSLQRLQTDYIDLYQLHGGTIADPMDETIEAFEILLQKGKIRYYGISSIRPNVIREYVRRSTMVSVMMQYGLLDRRPAESCLDLLHQNNIGVLARGSLARGLLVNKPATSFLNYTEEQVKDAAVAVGSISRQQRTASQTAIRFAFAHPAITSAVVGLRTAEQLEDVIRTMDSPMLNNEELEILSESIPVIFYEQHR